MNKLIVIAGNHQETIDYVVGECRHPNERGIFLIYGAASHNTLRGMQIDKGDEVVFTGTWYERDDIHELRHILHKQGWTGWTGGTFWTGGTSSTTGIIGFQQEVLS